MSRQTLARDGSAKQASKRAAFDRAARADHEEHVVTAQHDPDRGVPPGGTAPRVSDFHAPSAMLDLICPLETTESWTN